MSTNRPKVSILMPVKNASRYLGACLDSILDQSLTDWELIAVDDHSADDSADILQAYAQRDARINVLFNTGHGILPALKLALEHSNGTYVTRMDADDIMKAPKLELLFMQLDDSDLAIGLVEYFHEEGTLGEGYRKYQEWLNNTSLIGETYAEIYKECTVPSPCWMMSRDQLKSIGGFEGLDYPEDYDLAFRMYEHDLAIGVVPEVLHLWRDHSERTSRNDAHYSDNRFLDIKVRRFLELEQDANRLVLWGAGRKGKEIAALLLDRGVQFCWISGNSRKIGHQIYDQELISESEFSFADQDKIVVAIAGDPLSEVKVLIREKDLPGQFYFFA